MNQHLSVLLIEDNPGDAELFREMMKTCPGTCLLRTAHRLHAGLDLMSAARFDAVFLDLGLPDSSGIETFKAVQERSPEVPVIVLTGLADGETASLAISLGAQDYLVKGRYDSDLLYRSMLYSIERKRNELSLRERKDLGEAMHRLDNLIHSTLDLDAILSGVIEGAVRAIGTDAGVIGLIDRDRYSIKSAYNLPNEIIGQPVSLKEMWGVVHASRARDVIVFEDAPNDPRCNRDMVRAAGISSMLVAPLIAKGIMTGAVSLFAMGGRFSFREPHIDFSRKLAFSISTALENARLFDALKESERLSRARLSQLQAVYASAPVGLCFVDTELRFRNINERLAELNGMPPGMHIGRSLREVLPRDVAVMVEPYYRRALETGTPVENVEFAGRRQGSRSGERYWLNSYYPVRDSSGAILGVNAVVQEITGRKKMEEEIRHLANHDPLTGLPNRRLFIELIRLALAEARRHATKLAVLFLDLDRFKNVNDTLGHEAGDELLREVATRIRRAVRSSDTVARIGGDEFNLLIADVAASASAAEAVKKIIESFAAPFRIAGQELTVTPSIGISIYPDDTDQIETLLRYADIAMYHAKATGRNTFQFYNAEINVRSLERMNLENWLARSIERNELFIQYQPMINVRTGRIVSAEALVRWRHPDQGVLHPARFIPVAEETGFIAAIDQWVLRSACRQVGQWRDDGLPPIPITVNLSVRLFENPDLVSMVRRILSEEGIAPRHLDLEITESMAMTDVDNAAAKLRELADMGIQISIDDFGTGYSSLNYLKRLPIQRLKIDRSFVQDITKDPDDRTIISAVTAMAHNMNMKVIAEGVETEEQLEILRRAGCDEMQGFLFSRPIPAEEFRELMGTSG